VAKVANAGAIAPPAARFLAKRLRLPRQLGNDGKALVVVDLAEIYYKPMPARPPGGIQPDGAALKTKIEALGRTRRAGG
jgi:hypothetical protein